MAMLATRHFVENFLTPLEEGRAVLESYYDEERGLNVTRDGRALIDLGFDGGTVTGTKAMGEQEDRDDDLETFTAVEAEGFDRTAYGDQALPSVGTITMTRADAERDDADEDFAQLRAAVSRGDTERWRRLLGTITNTAFEVESSDVD
jgi:hypothetical protein